MKAPSLFALGYLFIMSTTSHAQSLRAGPITVTDKGRVLFHSAEISRIQRGPGQRLSARRVVVGGRVVHHVKVASASSAEGSQDVIFWEGPGHHGRLIFSGKTGLSAGDPATTTRLAVMPRGVLKYVTRPGYTDCRGQPLWLFPRAYDFNSGRFRVVVQGIEKPAAMALRASGSPPRGVITPHDAPTRSAFRFLASTSQRGADGAGSLVPPVELSDNDQDTSWIAGHIPSGRGQTLVARRPKGGYPIIGIRLLMPAPKGKLRPRALRRLLIQAAGGPSYRVTLSRHQARSTRPLYIRWPKPLNANCLSLTVEESFGKAGLPPLAIADAQVLTEADLQGGDDRLLADAMSSNADTARQAFAVIETMAGHGAATLSRLAAKVPAPRIPRTTVLLSRIPGREATVALFSLFGRRSSDAARKQLQEELRRRAPKASDLVLSEFRNATGAAKQRLATLVAATRNPDGRSALISEAGKGSDGLRQALVDAIVSVQTPSTNQELRAAIAKGGRPPQSRADLIYALGRRAVALPTEGRRAIASFFVGVLNRAQRLSPSFELRYRLIRALGRLGSAVAVEALSKAAADGDAIIRWQATLALQQIWSIGTKATTNRGAPSPRHPTITPPGEAAAVQLFIRRSRDPDPRVRRAAARALGSWLREDITARLMLLLQRDRWPTVATAAAWSLGRRCIPKTYPVLAAVAFRRGHGVDREAIASLLRCNAPNLFDALFSVAKSRQQPPAARQHALRSLPISALRGHEQRVLTLFLAERRRALSYFSAERVAAAAALTLGRAGYKPAVDTLAHALALDPSPSIRSAAATALGHICTPTALKALQRSRRDAISAVRNASTRGLSRCKDAK